MTDIVALDQRGGRGVDKVDLALSDLTEHLANCSTVVHLASAFDGQRSALQSGEIDVAATTRLLEAAAEAKRALIAEGLWSQYLEVGIGPDPEIFTKAFLHCFWN